MILDDFRLNGKVALVTGAAQGLGQGYAIALAEAGADIVALDRSEVAETGKSISALGRRFMPLKSDLREASVDDLNEIVADIVKGLPLSRMGTPEDVVGMCLFLLSDEASWITGQIFNVDGGQIFRS